MRVPRQACRLTEELGTRMSKHTRCFNTIAGPGTARGKWHAAGGSSAGGPARVPGAGSLRRAPCVWAGRRDVLLCPSAKRGTTGGEQYGGVLDDAIVCWTSTRPRRRQCSWRRQALIPSLLSVAILTQGRWHRTRRFLSASGTIPGIPRPPTGLPLLCAPHLLPHGRRRARSRGMAFPGTTSPILAAHSTDRCPPTLTGCAAAPGDAPNQVGLGLSALLTVFRRDLHVTARRHDDVSTVHNSVGSGIRQILALPGARHGLRCRLPNYLETLTAEENSMRTRRWYRNPLIGALILSVAALIVSAVHTPRAVAEPCAHEPTIASLYHCVHHAAMMGHIDNQGVVRSLLAKVSAAGAARRPRRGCGGCCHSQGLHPGSAGTIGQAHQARLCCPPGQSRRDGDRGTVELTSGPHDRGRPRGCPLSWISY